MREQRRSNPSQVPAELERWERWAGEMRTMGELPRRQSRRPKPRRVPPKFWPWERHAIEIRCAPCHRDLGAAAPLLATVSTGGAGLPVTLRADDHIWATLYRPGGWSVQLASRLQTRERAEIDFDHPEGSPPTKRIKAERPRPGARGVELACRRCTNKPRRSLGSLYDLAEQAVDSGERVVYV
jgi:hypothetical protein